ncbi:MAG: 6-carboxytetrahydropterin synthase QueD [Calditrichaeota bacterium]|nr:MAG: 6-carboxytetrahydropterin synthase QueD [Calditrichota bacterium]
MYKLIIQTRFSAAHFLPDYPGGCARVHGHNWKVIVTFASKTIDENGMVYDLVRLKSIVDECVEPFDHRVINEVAPFDDLSPTSENLARHVFETIARRVPIKVESVEIAETDDYSVTYSDHDD